MRVKVDARQLDALAADLDRIPAAALRDARKVVAKNLRDGNRLARSFATKTAGRHGKHYPRSITAEMTGPASGEYGPDEAMPQGGMSFEWGSRNQPPHLDLNRSADIVGPKFADDVDTMVGGLFW